MPVLIILLVAGETKLELMKHILIRGDWQPCTQLIQLLQKCGNLVSLALEGEAVAADFLLVLLADTDMIPY
jgi:hypothetical protein